MTAKEQKIAEIREALERATPGRWIYDETVGDVYSEKTDEIICCADVNDAHLIANAPEWLRFLLSELDRTERENRVLSGIAEKLRKENRKLLEERDKLIEVLRWYADKTNYVQEVHHLRHGTLIGPAEAIYYDEGQRARDILKEIGVMSK